MTFTNEYPSVLEPQDKSLSFDDSKHPSEDVKRSIALTVSPNPASDLVHITYPTEADQLAQIEIYDAKGVLVFQQKLNHHGLLEVNTKDWKEGLYLLRLMADGIQMGNGKFTIVRY